MRPSDSIKLYFHDLSEKNICQRLNNLKEKINNNKKLSIEDELNLGIILQYAPLKDAERVTETLVDLYLTIHIDLDLEMEKYLYSVIRILIDAYIDDEKTYRRLVKMIYKNTSEETEPIYTIFDGFLESIKYRDEDLIKLDTIILEKNKKILEYDEKLLEQYQIMLEQDKTMLELGKIPEHGKELLERDRTIIKQGEELVKRDKDKIKEGEDLIKLRKESYKSYDLIHNLMRKNQKLENTISKLNTH